MKKILALCVAAVAAGGALRAESESAYSVTVDFPYVTKYVFRGVELADSSVQPSVELAVQNFYFGVWNNTPLGDEHDGDASKEFDFYLGVSPQLHENLKADLGVTYYWYPWVDSGMTDHSVELYAGLNATLGNFTPSVYFYHDIDLKTSTFQAALGYSVPLKDLGTSLDFSASAGIVSGDGTSAYRYYSIGVNLPYKLSDTVKLNVGATYTTNDIMGAEEPGLWGTAGVTVSF